MYEIEIEIESARYATRCSNKMVIDIQLRMSGYNNYWCAA